MKIFSRILLCFLSLWLTSAPLMAGPLDKAKAAFTKGDFKKASSLAGKAGKKLKSKSEKAEALALAGAATVKMGKAGKGKAKFVKALKLDPNVSLPTEASGDKKVEKAFASAQKKAGTKVSDGDSGKSSDKLTKTASKGDRSPGNIKNYLPFGLNSYMQGKTLTAVAFGAAQAGGLLLFLNRKQAASDADKDAKAVIADAEANSATEEPAFLQFLDDNDAFVKKANSEASMALLITMAGYGLSVVDSLFDPLGTSKSASVEHPSNQAYANLGSGIDSRIDKSWKFDLQIIPSRESGLLLSMKQEF